MAVAYEGSAGASQGNGTSSISVTVPAGGTDDVVLVFVWGIKNSPDFNEASSLSGGGATWTSRASNTDTGSSPDLAYSFWSSDQITSASSFTLTVTMSQTINTGSAERGYAAVVRYSGVSSTPIVTTATNYVGGSGTSITAGSVSVTSGNTHVKWAAMRPLFGISFSPDTGWTERAEETGSTGGDLGTPAWAVSDNTSASGSVNPTTTSDTSWFDRIGFAVELEAGGGASPQTLTFTPAEVGVAAPDLTATPGAATVELDPAEVGLDAVDLTATPGNVDLSLGAAEVGLAGADATLTPGNVDLSLEAAEVGLAAPDLTATPGAATVELEAAEVGVAAPDLTLSSGGGGGEVTIVSFHEDTEADGGLMGGNLSPALSTLSGDLIIWNGVIHDGEEASYSHTGETVISDDQDSSNRVRHTWGYVVADGTETQLDDVDIGDAQDSGGIAVWVLRGADTSSIRHAFGDNALSSLSSVAAGGVGLAVCSSNSLVVPDAESTGWDEDARWRVIDTRRTNARVVSKSFPTGGTAAPDGSNWDDASLTDWATSVVVVEPAGTTGTTLTFTPAEVGLAGADATLTPGNVDLSLDPAEAGLVAPDLTLQTGAGPQTITFDPAETGLLAVDLTATPGSVDLDLDPAETGLLAVDLVIQTGAGPQTLTFTPAEVGLAGVDLTATPGNVDLELDPAEVGLGAVDLTATPGASSLSLDPAEVGLLGVDLTISTGGAPQTLTFTAAEVGLAAVDLTATPGNVQIDLSPAEVGLVAVEALAVPGAVELVLESATAGLLAVSIFVDRENEPKTITLVPAEVGLSGSDLTLDPGAVVVELDPAELGVLAAALTSLRPIPPTSRNVSVEVSTRTVDLDHHRRPRVVPVENVTGRETRT